MTSVLSAVQLEEEVAEGSAQPSNLKNERSFARDEDNRDEFCTDSAGDHSIEPSRLKKFPSVSDLTEASKQRTSQQSENVAKDDIHLTTTNGAFMFKQEKISDKSEVTISLPVKRIPQYYEYHPEKDPRKKKPISVYIRVTFRRILDINLVKQQYAIDFQIEVFWTDPNLEIECLNNRRYKVVPGSSIQDSIICVQEVLSGGQLCKEYIKCFSPILVYNNLVELKTTEEWWCGNRSEDAENLWISDGLYSHTVDCATRLISFF